MDYIYIAYEAQTLLKTETDPPRSIGAGPSLERLLADGIFLREREACVFLCRIIKGEDSRPQLIREAFVGFFSPATQRFQPADRVLAQLLQQTA